MSLGFLIPLAIALGSAYIFEKSAEEMALLAASIGIVSLLLSLILLPWQMQLMLLMFVLTNANRLSVPFKGRL